MRLILGQDEIIAEYVGHGLKRKFTPPFVAMGWVREYGDQWRLVAGAVFNDFNGTNLEISIYGPGALTRQTIRQCFRYVFVQCSCSRLTARTERGNVVMRRLLPKLGFVFEGEMKHYYGPTKKQNALVFRLDRRHAERWL